MTTRRRGSGWQADFMVAGDRFRDQFDTLDEAEDWEADTRRALRRGEPTPPAHAPLTGPVRAKNTHPQATLGGAFAYTRDNEWAHCKAAYDLTRNGQFALEHFGPDKLLVDLTHQEIDGYVAALRAIDNSPATINRKVAALTKMFNVASNCGVDCTFPKRRRQKEPEGKERVLSDVEEVALLDHMGLSEGYLAAFLVDTGLRVQEAFDLTWADCHPDHVTVVGVSLVDTSGSKSGKTRHVPLSHRAAKCLHHNNHAGPFAGMTYRQFRTRFANATAAAGLKDVTIHTLRHTAATRLVVAGVDIFRVMKFLGHADVKTTQRYAKLAPDAMAGIADVINQRTLQSVPEPA